MTEGNFVDYVKINLASGKGGKGSTHLRREKFVAKGGPCVWLWHLIRCLMYLQGNELFRI